MRKTLFGGFIVVAVAVGVTALAPAATAYWSVGGIALAQAQPTSLSIALEQFDPGTVPMAGEQGSATVAMSLTDHSQVPLDSLTVNTQYEAFEFDTAIEFAYAEPNTSCSDVEYAPLPAELVLSGYPDRINTLLCFNVAYSGANSSHIGQNLTLQVTASGTVGLWEAAPQTAERIFTLTDAPEVLPPEPIIPTVVCTPGEYLSYLAAQNADTTTKYQLRQGSANGNLTPYGAITASQLTTGWALSPANFTNITPGTTFTVFVVREGTTEAIGSAALHYSTSYQLGCG